MEVLYRTQSGCAPNRGSPATPSRRLRRTNGLSFFNVKPRKKSVKNGLLRQLLTVRGGNVAEFLEEAAAGLQPNVNAQRNARAGKLITTHLVPRHTQLHRKSDAVQRSLAAKVDVGFDGDEHSRLSCDRSL